MSFRLEMYFGFLADFGSASYDALREETEERVRNDLPGVTSELITVFEGYGWPQTQSALSELETDLAKMPQLVDFVIRFQHCEKVPESSRPFISGFTIAMGYFIGGLMPLLPYLLVDTHEIHKGLIMSIVVMVVALFLFGYAKTSAVTGTWFGGNDIRQGCKEGIQMIVVGSVAAAAAMGSVKLFSADEGSIGGNVHA